jgi:hypothetical protein
MNQCGIHEATHVVSKDGEMHRIASKWGISPEGRLAKPSEGGFGCITERGERIDMWQAQTYYQEIQEKPFMSVWTVYYDPRDYPGKYVVRRHDIFRSRTGSYPSDEHYVADSLEAVRERVPFGMACLMRSEGDEPQIVECWI